MAQSGQSTRTRGERIKVGTGHEEILVHDVEALDAEYNPAPSVWRRAHYKYCMQVLFSRGAAAAVFYGVMSTSLTFMNKALLSEFHFDFPIEIMLAQCWTSILCLLLLKLCSIYTKPLLPEDLGSAWILIPLAFIFSLYVLRTLQKFVRTVYLSSSQTHVLETVGMSLSLW